MKSVVTALSNFMKNQKTDDDYLPVSFKESESNKPSNLTSTPEE